MVSGEKISDPTITITSDIPSWNSSRPALPGVVQLCGWLYCIGAPAAFCPLYNIMSLSQFGIMLTMPAVNLTVDENTIFLLVLESLNMFFEVAKGRLALVTTSLKTG